MSDRRLAAGCALLDRARYGQRVEEQMVALVDRVGRDHSRTLAQPTIGRHPSKALDVETSDTRPLLVSESRRLLSTRPFVLSRAPSVALTMESPSTGLWRRRGHGEVMDRHL